MLGGRTLLVLFAGLLLSVFGLRARERLWSRGAGSYESAVPTSKSQESFRVFVFDAETGKAISGARVWFDQERASAVATDATGWLTLGVAENGTHRLHGLADGYAFHSRQVTVVGGQLADAAFRLQRGVTLAGTLRNERGEPALGTVELRRLDWEGTLLRSVETDLNGTFRFVDMRERSAELVARGAGIQGRRYVQLPNEAADIVLRTEPLAQMKVGAASDGSEVFAEAEGARRTVTVVDPNGAPVAGARISYVERGVDPALALFQSGGADLRGYSDPEGHLKILRDADGCLIARAWPFAASALEPCTSTEDGDDVTLRLRRPAFIRGVVAASDAGFLIAEAPEGFRSATDERSSFKLGPLGPGEHELLVLDPGGQPRGRTTVTIVEGEDADVTFPAP